MPIDIIRETWRKSKMQIGFPSDCRPFRPLILFLWSRYFDGINSCRPTFRQAKTPAHCTKGRSTKANSLVIQPRPTTPSSAPLKRPSPTGRARRTWEAMPAPLNLAKPSLRRSVELNTRFCACRNFRKSRRQLSGFFLITVPSG